MVDLLASLPAPTPDALRAARAVAGHSQAQAARCVGLAARYWPAAEQGRRRLSMQTWALYLLATGQHPAGVVAARPAVDTAALSAARVGACGDEVTLTTDGRRYWYTDRDGVQHWVDTDQTARLASRL